MPVSTAVSIIVVTYGALLVLWLIIWPLARRRFMQKTVVIQLAPDTRSISRPGSVLSGLGTLIVFIVNIGTIFLVVLADASPVIRAVLDALRITLPWPINIVGGALFTIYGIWGLLVALYNPNYTPLYRRQQRQIALAMHGPYAIVRHPRYAAEALLNIILFLFTGVWFPLLGILAWPAIWQQALSEEKFLQAVAPKSYGEYRSLTGMFWPRLRGRP
jgi:protein-S-isoprenylcysteine O-methyltransferase Ste14